MAADGLTAASAPDAGTDIALTLGNSGELRMLADDPRWCRAPPNG